MSEIIETHNLPKLPTLNNPKDEKDTKGQQKRRN
jgi:hypothetical protein